jgi:4-amino-4-deoxy-L-arabinose transferase-like glycosyltransferase
VRAFRWFVLALLVALTVPRMVQRGMFGDGLMYAVIARNMSVGVGSFWSPTYSPTLQPEWFEHPPLALGLEALAFRLLGDHLFVERVYSLATFAITALLIVAIWRRLHRASDLEWLPLFLWVLPSIVTWAVINNMLENTQTVFTTAAVWLVVLGAEARSGGRAAMLAALAGLASAAAVLSKGPVGFFPLAVPLFTLLLPRRPGPGRLALMIAAACGAMAIAAALVALGDEARHAMSEYAGKQVMASLRGERETNADPLSAFRHLGLGIAARMLVICGLCWLLTRPRPPRALGATPAWFFLAIAMAASLPIAASPKMVGHYFLPSVPFFALGIASLALPPVEVIVSRAGARARAIVLTAAAALVVASVAVPLSAGPIEPRDEEMIRNLDAVAPAMPRSTTIGTCEQAGSNWGLHSYIQRWFRVALDARGRPVDGWFLTLDAECPAPPTCLVAASGTRLALFRCSSRPFSSATTEPIGGESVDRPFISQFRRLNVR